MKAHKYCYYVCITTDEYKIALDTSIVNTSGDRSNHLRFEDIASKALERNPKCMYIVYWEECQNVLQAINRERAIKKLPVKGKKEIINKMNPEWHFLNDKFYMAIR